MFSARPADNDRAPVQLLHQALDLLVGRVFRKRVLQLLLQSPHLALGQ